MSQNNTHIPQKTIDAVNDLNIVDVVNDYVSLKKRGVNYVGLCPFHTDSKPSFYVSPNKQVCKCFACGESGGVIPFIQKIENVSYPQAIRILAKKHNIDIPEIQLTPEELAAEKKREAVMISLSATQAQFEENLSSSPDAKQYVSQKRQITDEFVQLYQLGYAAPDNQLSKLLPSKGYKTDTLIAAGVMSQNDNGYFYDRFRERITFPFFDISGKVVGFTGRDLTGTADAKYLNSPETDVYHKSQLIYGLHQARKRISETEKAYVVEGQLDVISWAQNGLQNTVGGSGTAFSEDQVNLLKRFARTVVLVYDGDNAGLKAALKQIQTFLTFGFTVKAFILPEGLDPDDLAKKLGKDELPKKIQQGEKAFDVYIYEVLGTAKKEKEDRIHDLDVICECISLIQDKAVRDEYMKSAAQMFEMSDADVKSRLNPPKEFKVKSWDAGFYGIDEAVSLLGDDKHKSCELTFNKDYFLKYFSEHPIVYIHESPSITDIQILRSKIGKFEISSDKDIGLEDYYSSPLGESEELITLKTLFFEGLDITVTDYEIGRISRNSDEDYSSDKECSFCDYYVDINRQRLVYIYNGNQKAHIMARCVDVIACLNQTVRTVLLDEYSKSLGIKKAELTKLLKPILAAKKDQSVLETQRLTEYSDALPDDPNTIPEYVTEDEAMLAEYNRSGFFPLCDKEGNPIAYMFRNPTGGGHTCISDFYMKPLLHIYSQDEKANKRVIELCHLHRGMNRYVEWQSNVLANLAKVNEKLIAEGAYNYEGTLQQWKKIWRSMSYNFTRCEELRIFGQQPEGFFAFGNAIHHKVKNEDTGQEEYRIDYVNDIGVVTHDGNNFYSPAFSKIYLSDRNNTDDIYKQVRYLKYKEIPEKNRLTFTEWAKLMNEVYQINDNGKWAILYAITCAFRDFIFKERRYFTALFFIGPTSSGKSQVATSIRNLFVDADTPLFNLNTGSFASLFMQMESFRNVPLILDEYNDNQISEPVFQALKAATLDGVGRTKVVDTASKITTSSEINASLILLGQEAPQQDGGSLANRVILRDVPYTPKGEFTERQTAIFEQLKKHERIGLCNILTEILSLRPVFEKHYLSILDEEIKALKERAKVNVTNTEGFTRILNAVSLLAATCRLVEEHTPLKLPFSYKDFSAIAVDSILEQLERIALSDKLTEFFNAINTLLTRGQFIIGREFKIEMPAEISRRTKGKASETVKIEPDTKVVYFDINAIYKYYEQFVGRDKAVSQQTIEAYFNSNGAYIGYCRAVRYKWTEAAEDYRRHPVVGESDLGIPDDNAAQRKMIQKNRVTTGHIFNYDILKSLMDIDLERIDNEPEENNQDEPPMPGNNNESDEPFKQIKQQKDESKDCYKLRFE